MNFSEVFSYRTQSVRDLVSVILGPPLVNWTVGSCVGPLHTELYAQNKTRLQALDEDSSEFDDWLLLHQKNLAPRQQ